jgi:hypothetical protein
VRRGPPPTTCHRDFCNASELLAHFPKWMVEVAQDFAGAERLVHGRLSLSKPSNKTVDFFKDSHHI